MRTLMCVYAAYSILSYPRMCMQVLASRTILHTPFYHLMTDRLAYTILSCPTIFPLTSRISCFDGVLIFFLPPSSPYLSLYLHLFLSLSLSLTHTLSRHVSVPYVILHRFFTLLHRLFTSAGWFWGVHQMVGTYRPSQWHLLAQLLLYCFWRLFARAGRGRTIQMQGSAHLILIFRRHNK